MVCSPGWIRTSNRPINVEMREPPFDGNAGDLVHLDRNCADVGDLVAACFPAGIRRCCDAQLVGKFDLGHVKHATYFSEPVGVRPFRGLTPHPCRHTKNLHAVTAYVNSSEDAYTVYTTIYRHAVRRCLISTHAYAILIAVLTIAAALEHLDTLRAENTALKAALDEKTHAMRLLARQVDVLAAERDTWRARAQGASC